MRNVEPYNVIKADGFFAKAFPVGPIDAHISTTVMDYSDIPTISETFKFDFCNAGYMVDGKVFTTTVTPIVEEPVTLGDILESDVPEKYSITGEKLEKWQYLKGAKKIERTSKSGHTYIFSEGPIAFPDPWDRPGRTMLTSESTLNRSTHVVSDPGTGRLRLLTPVEAERLQGFDDEWTNSGMPDRMRYFCMGNALVVQMITRMGKVLDEIISCEE
jgi:DNA (cytosine-5)-methyltransferase 1